MLRVHGARSPRVKTTRPPESGVDASLPGGLRDPFEATPIGVARKQHPELAKRRRDGSLTTFHVRAGPLLVARQRSRCPATPRGCTSDPEWFLRTAGLPVVLRSYLERVSPHRALCLGAQGPICRGGGARPRPDRAGGYPRAAAGALSPRATATHRSTRLGAWHAGDRAQGRR